MKPMIRFTDFDKLDLRVGKIISAEEVLESNKLIRMRVNLGQDYGIKNILAGIKGVYKTGDLVGKKCIFLANLEPKKLLGEESQGMVMAADFEGRPVLLETAVDIPEGTKIR